MLKICLSFVALLLPNNLYISACKKKPKTKQQATTNTKKPKHQKKHTVFPISQRPPACGQFILVVCLQTKDTLNLFTVTCNQLEHYAEHQTPRDRQHMLKADTALYLWYMIYTSSKSCWRKFEIGSLHCHPLFETLTDLTSVTVCLLKPFIFLAFKTHSMQHGITLLIPPK